MKKFFLPIIFLFLLQHSVITEGIVNRPFTPVNHLSFQIPEADEFSFAIIGDIRMHFRGGSYSPQTLQMMNEINVIGPSLVISVGDAYFGYGDSYQQFKKEIDYFLSIVEPMRMPFFNVIGNHDVAGHGKKLAYVKEKFGNSYGSFDFGNSHFIVLDTEEKRGEIWGDQLNWLKEDLEANKNARHIFVFMHRPLFSAFSNESALKGFYTDTRNRDMLTMLFRTHHVDAVFAGHEHLFHESEIDGVRYITTGGGGAPLYAGSKRGGFYHFLLVKVKGNSYFIETLKPDDLRISSVSGYSGADYKTVVEIANTSSSYLYIRNLMLKMPWDERQKYHVNAVDLNSTNLSGFLRPEIRGIEQTGPYASVNVGIHLLPKSTARITVIKANADTGNHTGSEIRRNHPEVDASPFASVAKNDWIAGGP